MQQKTTTTKAKAQPQPEPVIDWTSLVGRCFHVFEKTRSGRERVSQQGIVRSRVEPAIYLVQYFDWLAGDPGILELKRLEDMFEWQFYEDADHMKFWYDYRYQKPPDDKVNTVRVVDDDDDED